MFVLTGAKRYATVILGRDVPQRVNTVVRRKARRKTEVRLEPMRNAYSYEGILSAVGRVLDQAGIKRIAIQDTGDGLIVDGFDTAGESPISPAIRHSTTLRGARRR